MRLSVAEEGWSPFSRFSRLNRLCQYAAGFSSPLWSPASDEIVSLRGRLFEEVADTVEPAVGETPNKSGKGGMSGLKVAFFFPLPPWEDIIKVVVDFFLFKRGGEAGKKGFQPMRKKLGEKFGVVFSFAVVVTDTELQ